MSQRPGTHFDAGDVRRRVTCERRTVTTEGIQIFFREDTFCFQSNEKRLDAMAFTHNKTITLRIVEIVLRNVQGVEIQRREHVQTGQIPARVPCACTADYLQQAPSVSFGS